MEIEQDKIETLLQKEKVSRLNNDAVEYTRVLTEIVEFYYNKKDYENLFE